MAAAKKVDGDYHEPEFIQIVVSEPQRVGEFTTYKISTSVCTQLFCIVFY